MREITAVLVFGLILWAPAATAAEASRADELLTSANAAARAQYAHAKDATLASLDPIVVVESEAVTLRHSGAQRREPYLPPRYARLKALGHVAMGLYSLLVPHIGEAESGAWRADLLAYRAQIAALEPIIGDLGLHWDDAKRQREILATSLALIDATLKAGRIGDA